MFNTAYARNAYNQATVTTNTPLDLVIMLYSGTIDNLERAVRAIGEHNVQVKIKSVNSALAILNELTTSLNHEAGQEISSNLEQLYLYMTKELILANIRNDADKISHIISLLKTLQEGWIDIKSKNPKF